MKISFKIEKDCLFFFSFEAIVFAQSVFVWFLCDIVRECSKWLQDMFAKEMHCLNGLFCFRGECDCLKYDRAQK